MYLFHSLNVSPYDDIIQPVVMTTHYFALTHFTLTKYYPLPHDMNSSSSPTFLFRRSLSLIKSLILNHLFYLVAPIKLFQEWWRTTGHKEPHSATRIQESIIFIIIIDPTDEEQNISTFGWWASNQESDPPRPGSSTGFKVPPQKYDDHVIRSINQPK